MTQQEYNEMSILLKTNYGATEVSLDKNMLTVYGSDVDAVYVAVVVEYGHLYDVTYEHRDEANKQVVLKLEHKVVDNINKLV